jgi:FeS assembly SUF system protein
MIDDDSRGSFEFDRPAAEPEPAASGNPALEPAVMDALRTVYDPEIPVNLVELGLIYGLRIDADGKVDIEMTLTAPSCPVAGELPGQVEQAVRGVEGVADVHVELVWTPPWGPELMSEAAKLELGFL